MDDNTILWPSPPSASPLGAAAVHVWALSLQVCPEVLRGFGHLLDSTEQARAARIQGERARNRYVAGRCALRQILARHLNEQPASFQFDYTPKGKPFLVGYAARGGLHFNMAHSEDLAVVAVSPQPYIGIDLERVRPVDGPLEMAPVLCSAREQAEFQSIPPGGRAAAFLRIWTRKEAVLKATGQGIGDALAQIEVTFQPDQPARLVGLPEDVAAVSAQWSLRELTPAAGFIAVLAQPGQPSPLCCWHWKAELDLPHP
jgi:4'-phosphopantetheinyl transferase